MRINQVIAGAAVVLMVGAGCGDEEPDDAADAPTSAPAGSSEPSSSPPPDDEMGSGGGTDGGDTGDGDTGDSGQGSDGGSEESQHQGQEVPEGQVDGSALPDGYPQKATVGDDATVTVTGRESGCGEATAEVQDQTADQVSILLVHTVAEDDQMCTMDIRYPPLTVELDEPLGDRGLVLTAEERKE